VGREERKRRINIHFRQTAKAFRAARQTKVFAHINRNLPFRMYQFSKERFNRGTQYINRKYLNKFTSLRKRNPPS